MKKLIILIILLISTLLSSCVPEEVQTPQGIVSEEHELTKEEETVEETDKSPKNEKIKTTPLIETILQKKNPNQVFIASKEYKNNPHLIKKESENKTSISKENPKAVEAPPSGIDKTTVSSKPTGPSNENVSNKPAGSPSEKEPSKPKDPTPQKDPLITTRDVTDYIRIDYSIERISDSSIEKGKEVVSKEGSSGERKIVTRITYKDGIESSRKEISSTVTKEPVNRVILVGTKEEYFEPYYEDTIGSHGLYDSYEEAKNVAYAIEDEYWEIRDRGEEPGWRWSGWEIYPVRYIYEPNKAITYYTVNFY